MVPSLFQEAICSDLVFSRVLCFFETIIPVFKNIELIRHSSCSHRFNEWPFSIIKEQLQPHILSNLLAFCRTGVVVRTYDSYQL